MSDDGPVYDDAEFVGGPHDGEFCPVTRGVGRVAMPYGFTRNPDGSLSRLRYCWYSRIPADEWEDVARFVFVGFDE